MILQSSTYFKDNTVSAKWLTLLWAEITYLFSATRQVDTHTHIHIYTHTHTRNFEVASTLFKIVAYFE